MGNLLSADYQLRPDRDLCILIPARGGSKRVPGKNMRRLAGKPLLQWTIEAAKAANPSRIIVSTDEYYSRQLGGLLGCSLHRRKPEHATDDAPDILWVKDVLEDVVEPVFAICRPTSPFRTGSTIRRAYAQFIAAGTQSLRAVRPVTEHPGKMWREHAPGRMEPAIFARRADGTPWHSSPTQSLPAYYVQTASLEMAWTWVPRITGTIAGVTVAPFFSDTLERFDINTPEDFAEAERLATLDRSTAEG